MAASPRACSSSMRCRPTLSPPTLLDRDGVRPALGVQRYCRNVARAGACARLLLLAVAGSEEKSEPAR
jgi:hypothetical protein